MSCLHESNEIDTDMLEVPEDKEYIEETDTGDEPLRRQDSQPTQFGKRFPSPMDEAPDEEAENAHSRHLRQDDQTAQRSAANAENIAHSRVPPQRGSDCPALGNSNPEIKPSTTSGSSSSFSSNPSSSSSSTDRESCHKKSR